MPRKLSCYLLFIYLFANSELHQLLKMSEFVQHYSEHKAEDSDMTFFDFICLHYFSGGILDSDYDADMQLPFKTKDLTSTRLVDQLFNLTFQNLKVENLIYPDNLIFFHPIPSRSYYMPDIWQPPRA